MRPDTAHSHKDGMLLSTIVHYVSSNIFRQLLSFAANFIRPKFLTPEQFGLWNLLNLIPTYSTYSHLGSRGMMVLLVPRHSRQGDEKDVEEIIGSTYYGSLAITAVLAAGAAIYGLFGGGSAETRLGYLAMAVVTLLTWRYEFILAQLKCLMRFRTLASSHYLRAVTTFLLAFLVIPFRLYGVYAATILSLVIVILVLTRGTSLPAGAVFSLGRFRELVARGLPVMLVGGYVDLMRSTDKLIISFFLGKDQLGYYGLAAMLIGFLSQVPTVSREVLEPKMMDQLSLLGEEAAVREYFLKPLTVAIYFMPLMCVAAYFLVGPAIAIALPKYISAIPACKILALGVYFVALNCLFRGVIVLSGAERRAALFMGAALLLNAGTTAVLLAAGFGIVGVTVGNNVSGLAMFFMFLTLASRTTPSVRNHSRAVVRDLVVAGGGTTLFVAALESLRGLHLPIGYLLPLAQTAIFLAGWVGMTQIATRWNPLIPRVRLPRPG